MRHALSVAPRSVMITQWPLLLLLIGGSVWVAARWVHDYRAARAGTPSGRLFPGATPASAGAVAIASLGALCILAAETGGEHVLGLSAEQSTVTGLFGLYSLVGAPVIEEILFRGYLVIEHRGRALLWAGVVGVSFLFALLHPFLWEWHGMGLTDHFSAKAWFSTAVIFMTSL
jgi:membrane protease YdiL (CAAX protease family)